MKFPLNLKSLNDMIADLLKNKSGFALIGIIIVVLIIAAIFFGSSYFSKDENDISTPQGQIKTLNKAENDIDKINEITAERNAGLR